MYWIIKFIILLFPARIGEKVDDMIPSRFAKNIVCNEKIKFQRQKDMCSYDQKYTQYA
jgi:hypothetical protein